MNRAILLLFFMAAGLSSQIYGQGGIPLWTNRYNGPGNGDDYGTGIVVDDSGRAFVTGYSYASSGWPNGDFATVAYSSSGSALWTKRYNGPGNGADEAYTIALDHSGNLIVTGSSDQSTNLPYNRCWTTIKYAPTGVPLWTNRFHGPTSLNESATAVAVDYADEVFVLGSYKNGSNSDFATIKYSSAGVPLWTNIYDGQGSDSAFALAVEDGGNVFVTGMSQGIGTDYDIATLAYSSAGIPLWTNRFSGPGAYFDQPSAIAVDKSGNVFVTGYTEVSNAAPFNSDFVTIKYSGAGLPSWTNYYGGAANDEDHATALVVCATGDVVVTGYSAGTNVYPNDINYLTVAYSSAGIPLWTNQYNGPGGDNDDARAIAVDAMGNVFVTGYSYASYRGQGDCATVAYSASGAPLWTNRYDGPGRSSDYGEAIAVDKEGNVFVAGRAWNGTNLDYFTIKYSSSIPPTTYLDYQFVDNELVLNWTNAAFSLQSAPISTGTFTNLSGATSPHTNPISGAQQFFRLISN